MHIEFHRMTKPAFTHRPWCVTPCPTVHGGAFLFVKHNSTVSKQRSVSACKVYFTAAGASGVSNNLKIKKHRINAMHLRVGLYLIKINISEQSVRNRTRVSAVRGRRLNRLTNEPCIILSWSFKKMQVPFLKKT